MCIRDRVYRKLRPGEPPTVESATSQIDMLFFDPRRYDLSRFGRYKMNKMCIRDRMWLEVYTSSRTIFSFSRTASS